MLKSRIVAFILAKLW